MINLFRKIFTRKTYIAPTVGDVIVFNKKTKNFLNFSHNVVNPNVLELYTYECIVVSKIEDIIDSDDYLIEVNLINTNIYIWFVYNRHKKDFKTKKEMRNDKLNKLIK